MLVTTVFAERLKELRDSRRLTQDVLASQVGVSRQTISNWETGTSAPNAVDLPLLAQALGVTVARLYGDEPGTATIRPAGIPREERMGLEFVDRVDDRRGPGVKRLPIFRWGYMGDPRESGASPDREDYPPTGRESLVGPNGLGVEMRGDSMAGRGLHDGDIVWVNPDRPYRMGGLVLALVESADGESGMVVKTWGRTEVGECLLSETAQGKTPVVCHHFTIIGPVVGIQRWIPPP